MRIIHSTALVFALGTSAFAADREVLPAPVPSIDLTGYVTTKDLIKADPKQFKLDGSPVVAKKPGVFGVSFGSTATGAALIEDVEPDSPAEKAGLKKGDLIRTVAGQPARTAAAARELLRGRFAGDDLAVTVERDGAEKTFAGKLRLLSKPFDSNAPRAVLGLLAGEPNEKGGVDLARVTEGGPAAKVGIKGGDVLLSIDDQPVTGQNRLNSVMSAFQPGETVNVRYRRGSTESEVKVVLGAEMPGAEDAGPGGRGGRGGAGGRSGAIGWDDRLPRAWSRKDYKLAVIGVEYSDVKHNPKIKDEDWNKSLFSRNEYKNKSATGQDVHGSMNDYYHEISYGKFQVDGKFVGWVELPKKRMDYSSGSGTAVREKTAYFTDVLDAYLAKAGKDALKDFDGVFFVFAGGRVQTTRGSLYWPHRSNVSHNGKRWPYFIVQEGGERMNDISVFCHEFGHMLGLPDLYARPEAPGMEGVGRWCAMSQQNGQGRPQHFSVWCKEQLGWVKPTLIDPKVKQKIILAPAHSAASEFIKVPIRADGSEFLLLENRQKRGFDSDLPAEGLLVWRVIPNHPTQKVFLEEAHGVEGPSGPNVFPGAVPFPSPANSSFTPFTTPSSKSQQGGGFDVYITNVKRLPDGRVAFQIGYEYQ